MGKGDKKNKTR